MASDCRTSLSELGFTPLPASVTLAVTSTVPPSDWRYQCTPLASVNWGAVAIARLATAGPRSSILSLPGIVAATEPPATSLAVTVKPSGASEPRTPRLAGTWKANVLVEPERIAGPVAASVTPLTASSALAAGMPTPSATTTDTGMGTPPSAA